MITTTPNQQNIPAHNFQLIESEDSTLNALLATKSIKEGLKKGEIIVFVGSGKTKQLAQKLTLVGIDVTEAVKQGKLFIFSSLPAISGKLSLSTDYQQVFDELCQAVNKPFDCMIIMDVDALLTLESQYLAYASVSKFSQAANEIKSKVIAQYTRNQTVAHDRLEAACSSLVSTYFSAQRNNARGYDLYEKNTTYATDNIRKFA
jgi:hypothetical protein